MTQWYYSDGDNQIGPITNAQMKDYLQNGIIRSDTLVWKQGLKEWVKASSIENLIIDNPPPLPSKMPPPLSAKMSSSLHRNNSGMGNIFDDSVSVPFQIKKWNWAAFLLAFFWAIDNEVWIGLLSIIPYVGFIMAFILASKGNEWAWKSKKWKSVEHFLERQKAWEKAAFIVTGIFFIIGFLIAISEGY